jgi:RNA polymerase sigma factor for flagellar operon FliA
MANAKRPMTTARKGTTRRAQKTAPKAEQVQEDDPFSEESLTKVIRDYMPLVRHAVNRIAVGSTNGGILGYEDMVSYGVQGLIEAYYSFDPNKGAKFSTYALPRIRGSILDAIRATHPLPRSLQKFGSDLEKATSALHAKLGRAPTRDELAGHMGIEGKDFMVSLRTSSVRVVSLDSLAETAANGNSEKLWEMADDDPNIDPDAVAEETMVRARLANAVELLPEREKTIVRLYYMKSQSLKSIGEALGISESRASQLRHRAIRRLRTVLTQELQEAA